MDPSTLPWEKGIAAVFATALLIIFIDLTYRKIPTGMRRLRRELRLQTKLLAQKHDEGMAKLNAQAVSMALVHKDVVELIAAISDNTPTRGRRLPRRKNKSNGPAGSP